MNRHTHTETVRPSFLQPWHLHVPPQDDSPQTMEERYGCRPKRDDGWSGEEG